MNNLLTPKNKWRLPSGDFNLAVVIHFTSLIGAAGHFLFIFLFLWLGVNQMAWVNIGSCAIFLFCFWLNWRGIPHIALLLGVLEVAIHALLAEIYVGWESGFQYYVIGLIPLIFYSQSWRLSTKLLLTSILCGVYISLYLNALLSLPLVATDPIRLHSVGVANIVTLFIVFAAVSNYYRLAATNAENALTQANMKLKQQAHNDALTKLPNRRDLTERIEAMVTSYLVNPDPFCVILTDIDNFKKINDTYGHNTGDQILVMVGETLLGCMREHDRVGRWGGEEFLALLPGTHAAGAKLVAERMRQKISAMSLPIGENKNNITMTFGIAEFDNETDASGCINRADQAMYQGKISGKNCVKVHGWD
ncbi:GGDEF domain-containing protein [Candidatus Villigracilis saccharophilus]|uniref:GGDEF domain-containing protein n=1 Tax=Candidatus Villigracilis saccharophilus TaxID=3140684 RepID=UPI003136F8AF|nr:GGDEF domain-containing protein [Anaerolineales bacterium]